MQMHKVSVIIPVYNEELYLRECLDSVCAQTLRDIEIICVDDGSTDSSCDILREYVDKDSRVSVYHQQNQYCGIARNNGLDHSDVEYVTFWDSDDTFEPDALECMYNRAKEVDADICQCGVVNFDETHNIRAEKVNSAILRQKQRCDWFNLKTNADNILDCADVNVWDKLFRRAFLERIGLRFSAHRRAEDLCFTWIALCSADRITLVDKPLITYRVRSATSVSRCLDCETTPVVLDACLETARYLREHDIFPERSFANHVIRHIRHELRGYSSIAKQLAFIAYAQQNCLEIFGIRPREPGFYESADIEAIANHLLSDSPEEFLGFLNYETALQLSVISMKLRAKNSEIKRLRTENARLKKSTPKGFLHRVKSAVTRRLKKH